MKKDIKKYIAELEAELQQLELTPYWKGNLDMLIRIKTFLEVNSD